MVLDAKALTWAAQNNIDTAKLKGAKVPIYGKWYFPEIPAGVPLINLETGERHVFSELMLAGEVIWAPEADLRRANLLPADYPEPEVPDREAEQMRALHVIAPEPLLAIARPPGVEVPGRGMSPALPEPEAAEPPSEISGIHMPSASVAPLVLGVGFCIAFLGLITNVFILIVGLVWMLAGAVGWIRIGLMEAAHASHSTEHEPEPVA
ncbi:MAG: hypothetical protein JOZ81_02430 [Chloroflexi bacterium]|nr:hypothetical protein [Chloroflexota bacterium]MBV9547820.1 hypothetical protein [Chloroflexota bacterium]